MENRSKTKQVLYSVGLISVATIALLGCEKKEEILTAESRYLYVASGACYSGGGNTTFSTTTSSNSIFRIDIDTGRKDITLADYNASPSQVGDSPVGIASVDSSNIYVLIENTTAGARRIEKIEKKSYGSRTLFSSNTTALSTVLRGLNILSNGDLLISKNSAIERISTSNVRITKGSNPYVNSPAAPCATSTTLMSKVTSLKNKFIVFLHAAPSQNRIGFVKPEGYATAGDCSVSQAAPQATAYPVAMAYDEKNSKLLVAYAGNSTATDINSIYVYGITETETAVTVDSVNKVYDASLYPASYPFLLYGISEMVLDPINNSLYVATAVNISTTVANYAIEKFQYNPELIGVTNTSVLNRVGSSPFFNYGGETKCISSMTIAD